MSTNEIKVKTMIFGSVKPKYEKEIHDIKMRMMRWMSELTWIYYDQIEGRISLYAPPK